jgi:predicted dehydrogenase
VLAKMDVIVPNRKLDDNSTVLIQYKGGASGTYWASQIAIGHDNGLKVRIYGDKGSLVWEQENSEKFIYNSIDGTMQEIHRGHNLIPKHAQTFSRLPAGHPEGLIEAFANLYSKFVDDVVNKKTGGDYPSIKDGVNGLKFIESCLESNKKGNIWVKV